MNPIEFPDIQLIDIEIIEDQIKGTKKFISNQVEPGGAKLGIKFDHAFDLNDKIIRITLTLRVIGIDAQGLKIGLNGRYQLCFFFRINDLDQYLDKSNEEIQVAGELLAILFDIVLSTSRGILFERSKETAFKGIIIPIIDTSSE